MFKYMKPTVAPQVTQQGYSCTHNTYKTKVQKLLGILSPCIPIQMPVHMTMHLPTHITYRYH